MIKMDILSLSSTTLQITDGDCILCFTCVKQTLYLSCFAPPHDIPTPIVGNYQINIHCTTGLILKITMNRLIIF